jgi:hypothetical protein
MPPQLTRTVDSEQARFMVQSLTHFRWDTGFTEFCTALKLNPDHKAEERYRSFQSCIDQMQHFSLSDWAALVEAAETTSNTSRRSSS